MERENALTSLYNQLVITQETGKVDKSIFDIFDAVIEDCKKAEEFWMERKEIPIESAFLLYHSSRNSRLIVEKMKTRFLMAEEKKENPKVAEDSLFVFPYLNELCFLLSSFEEKNVTPELKTIISQKLGALRSVASTYLMLPSPEEEMIELNKKELRKCFLNLSKTLQAMFGES